MGWGLPGIKFVTGIGDGRNNEKTMTIVPSIAFPFPYPGQIFANRKLIQAYINYFTNKRFSTKYNAILFI